MGGRYGEMKPTINKIKQGWNGERVIRDILVRNHVHHLEADLLVKTKHGWQIWEIKHQDYFEKPPFDGHGLPKWQIDSRLEFQEHTGIRALLWIVDKKTNIIYWQYMDQLINGISHQTNGSSPRIIFPLESYNIYKGY